MVLKEWCSSGQGFVYVAIRRTGGREMVLKERWSFLRGIVYVAIQRKGVYVAI